MWQCIFFSMMLLVSLPDTETGEALRELASVMVTLEGAASSVVSKLEDSWGGRQETNTFQFRLLKILVTYD